MIGDGVRDVSYVLSRLVNPSFCGPKSANDFRPFLRLKDAENGGSAGVFDSGLLISCWVCLVGSSS